MIGRAFLLPVLIAAGIAAVLLSPGKLFAGETIPGQVTVAAFSRGDLSGWSKKIFNGETEYSIVQIDGRKALRAVSKNAASGLVKKIEKNPSQYPILRWSWKIEHTLKREDATKKSGDDFVARVYVVFPRVLFWKTRAINYVWSAKLPKGTAIPNAYTANAVMVAVESGDGKAGTWVNEERNVFDDYKRLFGEDPPPLGAVALMSDTDNTGEDAVAYFGDIFLAPGRP
ncbi:MAG: DUF3047 domain-containing protein [Geobacteraceae bacterium]